MAVEAVASFVGEKLKELKGKSLILDKVIDEVGEEIKLTERKLLILNKVIDEVGEDIRNTAAEEDRLKLESSRDERVKWRCDYLGILYQVEDIIETFDAARDQRRRGSLWPIVGFFNHLRNQCLRRKMEQIRGQIKKLNGQKPDCQATAGSISISSRSAQPLQQNGDHCSISSAADHEEKEANGSTDLRRRGKNSSSPHAPSFDEFVQQPRHEHDECLEEEEENQEAKGSIDRPRIGKSSSSSSSHGHRHAPSLDECLEDKKEPNYLASVDSPRLGKTSSSNHRRTISQGDRIGRIMPDPSFNEFVREQRRQLQADPSRIRRIKSDPSFNEFVRRQLQPDPSRIRRIMSEPSFNEFVRRQLQPDPSFNEFVRRQLQPGPSRIRRIMSEPSFNELVRRQLQPDPSFNELVQRQRRLGQQLQPTPTFNLKWDSSYNKLPFHSKLCLLYLTLFPKEYDIPVRRLLRLWLAEGFVKRSDLSEQKLPEDVAQEYFEHLVKTNMILISKFRSDGSARRCRLLGALYDKLLSKAQAISLFHIHRSNSSDSSWAADYPSSTSVVVRRIVAYFDIKSCNPPQLHSLRSYLSFNKKEKDTPAREVGQFLSRIISNKQGSGFGLLRVLDLEGVYKPSLPENLGDLFNLRYLGLRWTFLDHLPSSVGTLPYLETLDVKHTNINSLPNSIWKLKHLRHLNLDEIRLDMPPQVPPTSLTQLLTLWGLFVDDKTPVENGLNGLCDLRELGITFHLSSSRQQHIAHWVAKLTALQSLRLRSRDEWGHPSELCLKPLLGLNKLSHLYLLGKLQKIPDLPPLLGLNEHGFPPAVKVLTLSVSGLKDDPMPILGQLPSLTVLRLLADSYLGENILCPSQGFSKLRVLKLWMLKKLEKWDVEEGAMQSLKEVNIRCCHKLNNIPQRLLQSGTLEELVLTNMPDEFREDVRLKIESSKTSLVVKNWDFTPLPWEQECNLSDREH